MRCIPRSLIGAFLVAGCTRASGAGAVPTSEAPTVVPVGLVPASSASASASSDGNDTGSDEERSTSTSARPLDSCHLKATLHDGGPSAERARFTLTLKNEGPIALRLVMPGDGSDVGWRTPMVRWSAKRNGTLVAQEHGARCGFMNPIVASEVVTIAPGASREISDWLPAPAFPSGTYDLQLVYRNDPSVANESPADTSDEVKLLVARSSACEITSDTVRVTLP